MKKFKKYFALIFIIISLFAFSSCQTSNNVEISHSSEEIVEIDESRDYYSKDDVAEYIHIYNKLPKNYLTKRKAKDKGWIAKENNLWQVTDKGVIGGDFFGNYEEILPGSDYKECDVNYDGGKRNAERLVYDENGNIFYTNDHYKNFERLYWWLQLMEIFL